MPDHRRYAILCLCIGLMTPLAGGCGVGADGERAPSAQRPSATTSPPDPTSTTSSRRDAPAPSPRGPSLPPVTPSSPVPSTVPAGAWPDDALTPEKITDPYTLLNRGHDALSSLTSLRVTKHLARTDTGTSTLQVSGRLDGTSLLTSSTSDTGTYRAIQVKDTQYVIRDGPATDEANRQSGSTPSDTSFLRPFTYYQRKRPHPPLNQLLTMFVPPPAEKALRARTVSMGQGWYPGKVPVIEMMVTLKEPTAMVRYTYVVEARAPHRLRLTGLDASDDRDESTTTFDEFNAVPEARAPARYVPTE